MYRTFGEAIRTAADGDTVTINRVDYRVYASYRSDAARTIDGVSFVRVKRCNSTVKNMPRKTW
jgi:hypothetical protein